MRLQQARRPLATHRAGSPEPHFGTRAASGGSYKSYVWVLFVILLIPANIMLLFGIGTDFSSYYGRANGLHDDVQGHRIAVRHIYHRQPDEVWSVDAKERQVKNPHDSDISSDDVGDEESPEVQEESNDRTESDQISSSLSSEHYDPSDLMRQEGDPESEEEDIEEFSEPKAIHKQNPASSISSTIVSAGHNEDMLPVLPVQIETTRKTKTFVYFRSKGCPHLCTRAKAAGWTPGVLDFYNKIFPDMLLIRWTVYGKYQHLTKTMINQVGTGASCIGGGKGIQLLCRQQLATRNGCDFADLNIQPKQWNLQKLPQCEDFFLTAAQPENANKIWIMKPGGSFHGRGISLHRGDETQLRSTYGECKKKLPDGLIVQEYVMNPALIGGHKFDLRTYLLIASTKPFLVFYHDGFARRSEKPFSISGANLSDPLQHITNDVRQSEENHFFGFEQLEKVLIAEHGFPSDYMEKVFRPRAMRITNFLFHTAIDRTGHKLEQRNGRFQFFALDWMIDRTGASHLLEGNGDPSVKHYPGTDLTPALWESMFQLVESVHFSPEVLGQGVQVSRKFKYKGWKLVYNELEAVNDPYQPCKINRYEKEKHPLYSYE